MKTLPLLTWWLNIIAIATFIVFEVYSHNYKQQTLTVLIFKAIFLNSPFILLAILVYFREDIPTWLPVARLVILIAMIGLSGICHYLLMTSASSGSGILLTFFVAISVGVIVLVEAVAWFHVGFSR